jgi:hypothetical protein
MTWFEQLQRQPLWRAAEAFRLQKIGASHLAPCPACGEVRRSSSDRRKGPVYVIGGARWTCARCQAGGDTVALIAYGLFRERPPKGDRRWQDVRAWGAAQGWCDGVGSASTTWVPPRRDPDEDLVRPPRDQVIELWSSCLPVSTDPDVSAWIERRMHVDGAVEKVTERDLVRALPRSVTLPPWATYRGRAPAPRSWADLGHLAIVPMRDATGEIVSLRARFVGESTDAPKALPPVGFSQKRTIMCNGPAVELLVDPVAARATGRAREVVIAEGEPQWLAWELRSRLGGEAPIFGLVSGSWAPAMAVAVPTSARVIVCTDDNDAGDAYHRAIIDSLAGRATVLRWQPRRA